MTTFLIGQISGVKQQTKKLKDGGTQTFTLVHVSMQLEDKEGFPVPVAENVQFPLEAYSSLLQNKGKYIAIPYISLSTANGNYIFPNNDINYFVFDKNPLDMAKKV